MEKLTLKEREMNVLQWTDNNLSEMKHFCGKQCTITYETCCIDDYWVLKVNDSLKEKEVIVPIGAYVVEYMEGCFTTIINSTFEDWFGNKGYVEEVKKPNMRDLYHASKNPPIEDYKEPINVEADGQQNKPIDIIPEDTKVKVISARHCGSLSDNIYLNNIGTVNHYWKGHPFGEYNVVLDNGSNNCFDRDELVIIDETSD